MTAARRVLLGAVLIALLAYLATCITLYLSQDRLLYYPVASRAVDAPLLVLDRPGARVLVSTHPGEGREAVVYFGGNAEDTSAALQTLAEAWPTASIYAMHYRGHGGSEGRPREADLVADASALLATLRDRHPPPTLVGRSLGSGIATQVAAAVPVRRLVLVTSYASIAGLGAARFPLLPVRLLMRDRYDSVAAAARIEVPTTIIAAGRDEVIPPWSTRQLAAAFRPGVARSVVIPEVGHNDIDADPRYRTALRGAR